MMTFALSSSGLVSDTEAFVSEAARRDEPLLSELALYAYPSDPSAKSGWMIHHPLIVSPFTPGKCRLLNAHYKYKAEAARKAFEAGDYFSYIWLHERPYRLGAFQHIADCLDGERYWKFVRQVWKDTENSWQHKSAWRRIWRQKDRHAAMKDGERATLAALPDVIRVWRGVNRRGAINGLSWTLDMDEAIWFAHRMHCKRSLLVDGEVAKRDVCAYFASRGEKEIVSLKVKRLDVIYV